MQSSTFISQTHKHLFWEENLKFKH